MLDRLAEQHGTDKFQLGYCPHYEKHLPDQNEIFSLLEIGIHKGRSLRMWRDYFPNANIFGVDIEPEYIFQEDRITTFCGDASSDDFWQGIFLPSDLRIIIDDGSHQASDIVKAFQILWNHLNIEGIYIIEDLTTQWNPAWGGSKDGSLAIKLIENFMYEILNANNSAELHTYAQIAFLKKG